MNFLNFTWISKLIKSSLSLFSTSGTPSQRKTFSGTAKKTSTLAQLAIPSRQERTTSRKPSVQDLERLAAAEKKRQRRIERNKNV